MQRDLEHMGGAHDWNNYGVHITYAHTTFM